MKPLYIKIKKLDEKAVIPQYAHPTDAGLDLVATSRTTDEFGNIVYGTGIAVEIPKGHVGLIFPRSSIYKNGLTLTNSVGVIDSGYRGEIMAKFQPTTKMVKYAKLKDRIKSLLFGTFIKRPSPFISLGLVNGMWYEVGDRIAQLIIIPYEKVTFIETETLSDSDRGTDGYGSTGK